MTNDLEQLPELWRSMAHELRFSPAAMPYSADLMEKCAAQLEAALAQPRESSGGVDLQSMKSALREAWISGNLGQTFDYDEAVARLTDSQKAGEGGASVSERDE